MASDFDPEDIDRDVDSSGDEGPTKASDMNAGREHYQSVGYVMSPVRISPGTTSNPEQKRKAPKI